MTEDKKTVTAAEWRETYQNNGEGWYIVTINSDSSVVIRKSNRVRDDRISMTHRARRGVYRRRVKDKDYSYLRADMSEDVLSASEYDRVYKSGNDPRKTFTFGEKDTLSKAYTKDANVDG